MCSRDITAIEQDKPALRTDMFTVLESCMGKEEHAKEQRSTKMQGRDVRDLIT